MLSRLSSAALVCIDTFHVYRHYQITEMSSIITLVPGEPNPHPRTISPFKNPRSPPNTPGSATARIWDEYEKRAVENARKRDNAARNSRRQTQQSSRLSSGTVLDIIKSYDPQSSPRIPCPSPSIVNGSPQFDFEFSPLRSNITNITDTTTVATCKTCKQPVTSALGMCKRCKQTIVLTSRPKESTSGSVPSLNDHGSPNHPQSKNDSSFQNNLSSPRTPPGSASHRSSETQPTDFPIRLSSLRPPPPVQGTPRSSTDAPHLRQPSITDPSDPFLRLQHSRKHLPRLPSAHASTPTTPPSTSRSHMSAPRTRPISLANVTTPPTTATTAITTNTASTATSYETTRHTSTTPSEFSGLCPCVTSSSTATSLPSVCHASYQLQNTTSAWDDWDSEDEKEKLGLVWYWRARKWRGSRGSLGAQQSGKESMVRDAEAGKAEAGSASGSTRRKRGFIRVISCGCSK